MISSQFSLRRAPVSRAASLMVLLAALGLACAPPSTIGGVTATPASPGRVWTAPKEAGAPLAGGEQALATRGAEVPAEVTAHLNRLSLNDVVDLALSNSPLTRATWAQARASAATYGSASGRWLPSVTADVQGGPSRSVSTSTVVPSLRTNVSATLSLQYLLLDFGARSGTMAAAHEALFAADLTHNATIQNVVLQSQSAYFALQASRGLAIAAQEAVGTAKTNLEAANRRHDVGLATIADVLQAKTALAQSQLVAQSADGNVQAARAQVALAVGLAANSAFDVAPDTGAQPVMVLAENVDSLVERAVRGRPDVAAARALARQSSAQVRAARSATLPSFLIGANLGQTRSNNSLLQGSTNALTFEVNWPLFTGFSREYDVVTAQENAAATAARSEQARLLAIAQVFTSYYALQTATQRVSTSAELLTSATQSEEVARGRYAEGVGSILDLLTAQSALADARAQVVLSRWTWYTALAQLGRDSGVLGSRGEANLTLTPAAAGRK